MRNLCGVQSVMFINITVHDIYWNIKGQILIQQANVFYIFYVNSALSSSRLPSSGCKIKANRRLLEYSYQFTSFNLFFYKTTSNKKFLLCTVIILSKIVICFELSTCQHCFKIELEITNKRYTFIHTNKCVVIIKPNCFAKV